MNLALGVLFMWFGGSMLYIATHGLGAATPWEAFSGLLGKIRDTDASPGLGLGGTP